MMEAWWRVLKTEFRLPSEMREGDRPVATKFNDETMEVEGSYLYPHLNPDLEDNPTETARRIIHEDMHAATLPELFREGIPHDQQPFHHIEFPAHLGEEVYEHWLASQGKLRRDNPDNPQKRSWQKRSAYMKPNETERFPEKERESDPAVLSQMVSQAIGNMSEHPSLSPDQSSAAIQRYRNRVSGSASPAVYQQQIHDLMSRFRPVRSD